MKKKTLQSLSNIIIFTLSWVPFSRNEILAEMCKGAPQSSVLHNCQIISIFMVRQGVGEKSQKSLLSNGVGGWVGGGQGRFPSLRDIVEYYHSFIYYGNKHCPCFNFPVEKDWADMCTAGRAKIRG